MATLSLRVCIVEKNVTKTMQLDPSTTVFDACRIIREKISEAKIGQPKDYGLFLPDDDENNGVWMEQGRDLEFYVLRNGDLIEYKKKLRTLRVKMLDGTVKTMMVDDSQPVANLMVVMCFKIGITNHDEYGLVRESDDQDIENRPNYGTLTLKRKKEEKERDVKMDLLRRKIKTDDEVNWVDGSRTLREQGIGEGETVLLKRKFFFSDQNIDSRDPIQLNLLYVQARDGIISGTHPVTQEVACILAGYQCHIQFGDHNADKHRPSFLDLKEFLPQSYIKVKGIEKKIFSEHSTHIGKSELDVKVLYTKLARSLPTYGVTFFLVKEKMKGKNKLVPRLLGVNKDSVLRLDEKTKEILKTWSLTTVRRWGASPNTFTLDFGDYSDEYYSVQTSEAEQIAQLIAGYIDIIMKKRQTKEHFGIEGEEGSTMIEDNVTPLKATILQHETNKVGKVNTESVAKPAVMRAGADGARPYGMGHVGGAQYTTISGQINIGHTAPTVQQTHVSNVLSEPQQALLSTISQGQQVITTVERELYERTEIPNLGDDPASLRWKEEAVDTNKQNVSSQLAAMNAATAQVVTLTSGSQDEVDHTAVGAAITTITSGLPEVSKGVLMLAALSDQESGDKLLDATRKLCSAFSDLLKAAEPSTKQPRQNLLNAASRVGEATHKVLTEISEEDEVLRDAQDTLLGLGKAVANKAAALVLRGKSVASTLDQRDQTRAIGEATKCALSTSQLVACAKVVAPTIQSGPCREQLVAAVKEVSGAVESLVHVCNESCTDQHLLYQLSEAAQDVTTTLNHLLNHIKQVGGGRECVESTSVEKVLLTSERVLEAHGDAGEMVKQARLLGQATAHLIQSIKGEAESQESGSLQRRLLAAAKLLAEATARMVEAARACASNPQDSGAQTQLKQTVEDLRAATTIVASPAIRNKLISALEYAGKEAADASTQCIASCVGASRHNTNKTSEAQLSTDCEVVQGRIPGLLQAVKHSSLSPNSPSAQLNLINICHQFIQPGFKLVTSARSVLPTVRDQATALQLSNSSQTLNSALSDLQSCVTRSRQACGTSLEIQASIDSVDAVRVDVRNMMSSISTMRSLPGETSESACRELNTATTTLSRNVSSLVTAASQGDETYTAGCASDTANSLDHFTKAVRAVSTTTPVTQSSLLFDHTEDVVTGTYTVIQEAQRTLHQPENTDNLHRAAKKVITALNDCINCLPGQKDVDEVIRNMESHCNILNRDYFPTSGRSFGELQQDLDSKAEVLNQASSQVVTSATSPIKLATSARHFDTAMSDLMSVGMEMAGQSKDVTTKSTMVHSLKNVTVVSSQLLTTAKYVSNDPGSPTGHNRLTAAARAVTESINTLVNVCTSSGPGQKECDNTIRNIESMRPMLQEVNHPFSNQSYFECLEQVMESSKNLGNGMTGIASHARDSEHQKFSESVKVAGKSIVSLIEAAAQAAYLIGVSEPGSTAGSVGLINQAQFTRALQDIATACSVLKDHHASRDKVISAATDIAKHTSALCNACRSASFNSTNPNARRQFVTFAKEVANSTALLVKEIKTLDHNESSERRRACAEATGPVMLAVESLVAYASAPDFAGEPAIMSSSAKTAQSPVTQAATNLITASTDMIRTAKLLAMTPKDPPSWQLLANHSRSVSDSIKNLVAFIRDKTPGQEQCDSAAKLISEQIGELDRATLSAVSSGLIPSGGSTRSYNDRARTSMQEIADNIEPLRSAAKSQAENIGHLVSRLATCMEPLVSSCVSLASSMSHNKQQMVLLDHTKSVAEAALQLVHASKESGGNPKALKMHAEIDDSCGGLQETLADLTETLEKLQTQEGVIAGIVDNINRSINRLNGLSSHHRSSLILDSSDTFVDYQTRMVSAAKEIARLSQEIVIKKEGGKLCSELSHYYTKLAQDCAGARVTSQNPEVAARLSNSVQQLGSALVTLISTSYQITDGSIADLTQAGSNVTEKVAQVLSALQAVSRGTQACITAASTVSGIIGDLDTTIMFASAGTLNAENENDTFADHRENILKTAKALVEDTKTLVAGAASSQEQLAVAAQNAVSTITQLAEVVKFGAASLGSSNPEAQVMLINAVKDVASALGDLIQATKAASGKTINDPSMNHLKDSARVMVTNVTTLLRTVKDVEDEHTRGTRALESTIEAISQEIRALHSAEMTTSIGSPEQVVRCTKPITQATSKAVAAGNSCKQEDIIVAANMGRKAISDMLTMCKGTAAGAENEELREKCLGAGQRLADEYRALLKAVQSVTSKPGTDKTPLSIISRRIAQYVTELVSVAEQMKGSDLVDPDDPTVIAENELLGAAASIDAAAKKLASLRPRKSISHETDDSLNFDEMILEAAKSIAAATSLLVKAASAAQRELIDSGKVSRRPSSSSDDGQWSEGLVSAARLVAAATHSLVDSANCLVQGMASEEKLISSAKQVASWTAHLLVACKVKADPNSDTTLRLQGAGNAVKRATDNLVTSAKQAIQQEEERSLVLNRRMVGGIAQEINARTEVLRIERELEEARGRLTAIRQAKYKQKPGDTSDSEHSESRIDFSDSFESPRVVSAVNNSTRREDSTSSREEWGEASCENRQMYVSSTHTRNKLYDQSGFSGNYASGFEFNQTPPLELLSTESFTVPGADSYSTSEVIMDGNRVIKTVHSYNTVTTTKTRLETKN